MEKEKQPNFFFKGLRKFAEWTIGPLLFLDFLNLFVLKSGILAAEAFKLTLAEAVVLGMVQKPKGI